MTENRNQNEDYKIAVILGVIVFLLWIDKTILELIWGNSKILGFIAAPILLWLVYKIIKAIWPDWW